MTQVTLLARSAFLEQLEEPRHYLSKKHILGEGVSLPVGLSVGIARFPQHVSEPKNLIAAADEALLRAKREGPGQVTVYVQEL